MTQLLLCSIASCLVSWVYSDRGDWRVLAWGQCDAETGWQPRTQLRPCRVDGGWTEWTRTGDCICVPTGEAGTSYAWAMRRCDNPFPRNGGSTCDGPRQKRVQCGPAECPVSGEWCDWGPWDEDNCQGCVRWGQQQPKRTRTRTCQCPEPLYGGECDTQFGSDSDEDDCPAEIPPCEVTAEPGSTLGANIDWNAPSTAAPVSTTGAEINWDDY